MTKGTALGLAAILIGFAVFTFVLSDVEPRGNDQPVFWVAGRAEPNDVYDPVRAGEELPRGYRQLLPRDAIRPVYDPVFVPPNGVDWGADTLVIGVAHDHEAKAYPVSFLNRREMVLDELGSMPILVTW